MSISLATLQAKLTAAVPARNGVPSTAQYQQCVEDAVADLSQRKSNEKVAAISIVSGTGGYTLPDDFVRLIALEKLLATDGVLISDVGLIPVDAAEEELFTIAGLTLTITPTPSYTTVRRLRYASGHVLNVSVAYPDLTAADARLALLKAQALAMELQASAATAEGWQYQIGDEMVDKSSLPKSFQERAKQLDDQYLAAVGAAVGAFGVRG